jgi:hypothetical protein
MSTPPNLVESGESLRVAVDGGILSQALDTLWRGYVQLRSPENRGQWTVAYVPPPNQDPAADARLAAMEAASLATMRAQHAAVKEDLVGAMFTMGQTYMSEVVAAFLELAGTFKVETAGKSLTFVGLTPPALREYGLVAGQPSARFVHAVANCWKHRDEWNIHKLTEQQSKTISHLYDGRPGFPPVVPGALLELVERAFAPRFNTDVMWSVLTTWGNALRQGAAAEIAAAFPAISAAAPSSPTAQRLNGPPATATS